MFLEKLGKITSTELKINLLPQILISFFIIICAKTFYGFSNLSEIDSLLPLERFVPLIGLVLITLALEPEVDFNIYQVVKTRQTPLLLVYMVRLLTRIFIFSLFIISVLYYMNISGSKINYIPYFLQTLSIGMILGSIGFLIFSISQNKIYALLGTLSYYLANWFMNYEKMNIFYLFRLSKNLGPLNNLKLIIAFLFILIGLIVYLKRKS